MFFLLPHIAVGHLHCEHEGVELIIYLFLPVGKFHSAQEVEERNIVSDLISVLMHNLFGVIIIHIRNNIK